jgi:outer membrane protein assembly factor BamB
MPNRSNATPIVFEDRVFVTSASADGTELLAICVDRAKGTVRWQKTVSKIKAGKISNDKNTLASPSPVTDGKQVLFTYGTGELFAFDLDGKETWSRNLPKDYGIFTFMHGYSSTPLLYKNKLYIEVLRRDRLEPGQVSDEKNFDSYLLCLDWATGKEIFKTVRKTAAKDGENEAYSSPIPYEHAGRTEILLSGALWVSGHSPDDGKEYWHWGTLTPWVTGNVRSVSVPVTTSDMIFAGGPRTRPVFAIKSGGKGDVSATNTAWTFKDHDSAVCSPMLYDGFLYLMDGGKRKLTCLTPGTAQQKWTGSLETPDDHADFSASPAAADGKIYCVNERGSVVILAAQEYKVLHRVILDEGFVAASPAIAQGHVFIRTAKNLYCLGK